MAFGNYLHSQMDEKVERFINSSMCIAEIGYFISFKKQLFLCIFIIKKKKFQLRVGLAYLRSVLCLINKYFRENVTDSDFKEDFCSNVFEMR